MARVDFYHLQRWPLERALPELLERVLAGGMRAVVAAGSPERVRELDGLLWTYREDSWLPHAAAGDGDPVLQPVWLTAEAENPNSAEVLVLTDGADFAIAPPVVRCLDLFDATVPEHLEAARARWRRRRAEGHELVYWQQTAEGRWLEKAHEAGGKGTGA